MGRLYSSVLLYALCAIISHTRAPATFLGCSIANGQPIQAPKRNRRILTHLAHWPNTVLLLHSGSPLPIENPMILIIFATRTPQDHDRVGAFSQSPVAGEP